MAQETERLYKRQRSGGSNGTRGGRGMTTAKSSEERLKPQHRVTRWYPKMDDNMIIERWADACSQKHESCCNCTFLEGCQDLVDRLIACMDVRPPRHREVVAKDYSTGCLMSPKTTNCLFG